MERDDRNVGGSFVVNDIESRESLRRALEHNIKNRVVVVREGDTRPSTRLTVEREIVIDRRR